MKNCYNPKKKEDINPDYYLENDLLVFKESYHLKRGYCCKSKCRHCPFKHKKRNSKSN